MTVQMEMGIRRMHTSPQVLCIKDDYMTEFLNMNGASCLKYTSLRDIIPTSQSSMNSPKKEINFHNCDEITFKNSLVKHAARAYLQPMVLDNNDDAQFFDRCFSAFSGLKKCVAMPIDACVNFFSTHVLQNAIKTFDFILGKLLCVRAERVAMDARHIADSDRNLLELLEYRSDGPCKYNRFAPEQGFWAPTLKDRNRWDEPRRRRPRWSVPMCQRWMDCATITVKIN